MKRNLIMLFVACALACLAAADAQAQTSQTLTLADCRYKVTIIEGDSFVFPKNLGELSLRLKKLPDGWLLSDTSEAAKLYRSTGSEDAVLSRASITIAVPKGANVDANVVDDLTITVPLNEVKVKVRGSSMVSIAEARSMPALFIHGSVVATLGPIETMGKVMVSGSAVIEYR